MKALEWTEAHQREALRRMYEIAAGMVGAGCADRAAYLLTFANFVVNESRWRDWLSNAVIDPARADREVRRVDRLARGEWVRETSECWTARPDVPSDLYMSKDPAPVREWVRTRNRGGGRRRTVVKVTTRRIRRAP